MKKGKLEDKLTQYVSEEYIPFHMPGHKRNTEKYGILNEVNRYDITEIDGFDNYHHPTGIIKEEFEEASRIYGSDESFYLVNGCSCGVLAAVSSVFDRGSTVLVARNCHKSVYNAIYMQELTAVYIYPDTDRDTGIYAAVSPDMIKAALEEHTDIKGIIITSPTYEGIVSDIKEIAKIAHKNKIPLIVDEAHGAHFNFYSKFPESALDMGADIVIQGLHKTMPSLTQTAVMHVKSSLVDKERLRRYISIYQTTSPSYLFMASIGSCIRSAADMQQEFELYYENLSRLRNKCEGLINLRLYEPDKNMCHDFDASKLVLVTQNADIDGRTLAGILKERYKIETEMASLKYIILMTSVCDDFSHYDRLYEALAETDRNLGNVSKDRKDVITIPQIEVKNQKAVYSIYKALNMDCEDVDLDASLNRMAGDYVYVYPPGIPIIVPGEIISEGTIRSIKIYKQHSLEVIGLTHGDEQIKVVKMQEE